jgi:hypothetical protein
VLGEICVVVFSRVLISCLVWADALLKKPAISGALFLAILLLCVSAAITTVASMLILGVASMDSDASRTKTLLFSSLQKKKNNKRELCYSRANY